MNLNSFHIYKFITLQKQCISVVSIILFVFVFALFFSFYLELKSPKTIWGQSLVQLSHLHSGRSILRVHSKTQILSFVVCSLQSQQEAACTKTVIFLTNNCQHAIYFLCKYVRVIFLIRTSHIFHQSFMVSGSGENII